MTKEAFILPSFPRTLEKGSIPMNNRALSVSKYPAPISIASVVFEEGLLGEQ